MAWRIVIANNKGGAGKSAVTAALAAALSRLGFQVTVVDMDPQGNLTRRMGHDEVDWPQDKPTVADALRLKSDGPVPLAEVVVECAWEHDLAARITLVPSIPPKLEQRAREGGMENGANYRLRRQLDRYDTDGDITLIDVPPGLGHLTDMALAAADAVLLVLQPEYDYVQGATRMLDYVETEREDLGRPDLEVIGVITTNVQDTATHRRQLDNLPAVFGELVWSPAIPHRATWSAANSDALPIELVRGWQAGQLAEMFTVHARALCARLGIDVPAEAAPAAGGAAVVGA